MIGLGLTNKEIARELEISSRTVGAHVQNILNKLSATNRAQIATWSAQHVNLRPVATVHVLPTPARSETPATPRPVMHFSSTVQVALLVMAGVLFTLVFPADHTIAPAPAAAAVSSQRGDLVYEARFDPDGHEFSLRYVLNEPDASAIRFVDGGSEYSVLKVGGNTGNSVSIPAMPAFFVEYEISAKAGSNVVFWMNFSTEDATKIGVHLLEVDTSIEAMQLGYFTGGAYPILPLGPQVAMDGLQSGRHFTISALVQPPIYRVFLEGVRVTDVTHRAPREHPGLGFGVFGNGTGTVRLSAIRVYTAV
jgi:regulatory LuxR family protein